MSLDGVGGVRPIIQLPYLAAKVDGLLVLKTLVISGIPGQDSLKFEFFNKSPFLVPKEDKVVTWYLLSSETNMFSDSTFEI